MAALNGSGDLDGRCVVSANDLGIPASVTFGAGLGGSAVMGSSASWAGMVGLGRGAMWALADGGSLMHGGAGHGVGLG
jgi:hypothetical protein